MITDNLTECLFWYWFLQIWWHNCLQSNEVLFLFVCFSHAKIKSSSSSQRLLLWHKLVQRQGHKEDQLPWNTWKSTKSMNPHKLEIGLSTNFWVSSVSKALKLPELLGAPNVQSVPPPSSMLWVHENVCSPLPFCVIYASPQVSLFTSMLCGAVFRFNTYRQLIHQCYPPAVLKDQSIHSFIICNLTGLQRLCALVIFSTLSSFTNPVLSALSPVTSAHFSCALFSWLLIWSPTWCSSSPLTSSVIKTILSDSQSVCFSWFHPWSTRSYLSSSISSKKRTYEKDLGCFLRFHAFLLLGLPPDVEVELYRPD